MTIRWNGGGPGTRSPQHLPAMAGEVVVSVAKSTALFCVSVDGADVASLSTEHFRRKQDVFEMLESLDIPSNWTVDDQSRVELPSNAERTVSIPKGIQRPELVQHLRQMNAFLLRDQDALCSVVADPYEARTFGDVLVRHGCQVTRPRTAEVTRASRPQIVRGGLWSAPLACSFVGGSRRSVRSLFGICQRRLVETSKNARLFHLNIDLERARDSWAEERSALQALLKTASDQQRKEHMRCLRLSELPATLTKKATKPMLSILKAA